MIKRRHQGYRYKEVDLLYRRATLDRVTFLLIDDSRSSSLKLHFHDLVRHSKEENKLFLNRVGRDLLGYFLVFY
jgi:hypothetical protein